MTLGLILLVCAFICLLLAAFGVSARRVSLGWLGLAFWCASILFGGITIHGG